MAVERFKHDGKWKIIGSSSSGKVQISDDKLDSESINSVQNKVITKALENKADIVDTLVNANGIRSEGNVGYYMPNISVGDSAHTLATKADIISNEALESKATMYNLYAMDELSEERLEANAKALESVQNREVAIYKVYTNDDTYAIADVKLVPGLILEAYVYVNNPDIKSKQATVTKYTYSFDQTGEYMTGTKQEIVVPSLSKVEEIVVNSGGGGLETRILYVPEITANSELTDEQKAYNAETCQKMMGGTAIAVLPTRGRALYSDNIIDLVIVEEAGYVINFNSIGGFYLCEGDILASLPDISMPIVIPADVDAYDPGFIVAALSIAPTGSVPAFYLQMNSGKNIMCSEFTIDDSGLLYVGASYMDGMVQVSYAALLGHGAINSIKKEVPLMLTLGALDDNNAKWMEWKNMHPRVVPTLIYDKKEYVPVSIDVQAEGSTCADFTIYKDGAFETWRMTNDGSTTKL